MPKFSRKSHESHKQQDLKKQKWKIYLKKYIFKSTSFVQQKNKKQNQQWNHLSEKKCSREMTKNNHPVKKIRQESDKKTSSPKNCRINLKRSAKNILSPKNVEQKCPKKSRNDTFINFNSTVLLFYFPIFCLHSGCQRKMGTWMDMVEM